MATFIDINFSSFFSKADLIKFKSLIFLFNKILVGTFLLMLGAVSLFFILAPYFERIHLERMSSTWGIVLMIIGFSLLTIKLSFITYILFLYLKYKVVKPVSDSELPLCTVIVPAYNEGELVYKTLKSLVASDYPEEKLQIISIDDGSQDNTWEWMKKAQNELGNRVSIYQQPENRGKRHALYRGFKLGTGDVFITVDSDSIVLKDTLRTMASPFVVNQDCGAVAGNVRVLNSKKALIEVVDKNVDILPKVDQECDKCNNTLSLSSSILYLSTSPGNSKREG